MLEYAATRGWTIAYPGDSSVKLLPRRVGQMGWPTCYNLKSGYGGVIE